MKLQASYCKRNIIHFVTIHYTKILFIFCIHIKF